MLPEKMKKLDLNMVPIQMIHLFMTMNHLLDIKNYYLFQVDYDFVSNNEWREFIDSNGYKRPELWLSDGWEFINKYKINKPMYWIDQKYQFCLTGIERIDNDQPVSHISYYEADAFCRFRKRRMPTEFEMEFFLKKNKKEGQFS